MTKMRDAMPQTTRFIDWLRQELGAKTVDAAIRDGMSGEPTFFAEENGHRIGTPATITPSANAHTFTERELADKGAGR